MGLAKTAAEMPVIATRMIKEAVNLTDGALNPTASFADAEQSQLTMVTKDSMSARDRLNEKWNTRRTKDGSNPVR